MQRLGLRLSSASTRAPSAVLSLGRRRLHQPQKLLYPVEEGLGNFLPPDALKVQVEWQNGLLERLNEQVAYTAEAGTSIVQTIINLAGNKSKILAFNYASLALNNSFFLNSLKPPSSQSPTYEHEITAKLMSNIREHHGGIEQLRSAFSAAALGTFTNGWVWFVSDQVGHTATMTTYGPSTLLIRARTHMEPENNLSNNLRLPSNNLSNDPRLHSNTPLGGPQIPSSLPDSDMPLVSSSADDLNSDASFMSTAPASIHRNGGSPQPTKSYKGRDLISGELLYPLFCLPVYEHTWMSAGYGVWGKEQWLKEFWSVLDWRKVNGIYENITNKDRNTSYA